MAWIYADRVLDTSVTTGTGALTLSGTSPLGWRTFSTVCAVADQFYYTVVDPITGAWETGEGNYSATNTVTRTTVRGSSNAGALVSFAGNAKSVFIDVIGQYFAGIGGQTFLSADVALTNFNTVFNIINTGSIGGAGQIFEIEISATLIDTSGTSQFNVGIHDGTNYLIAATINSSGVFRVQPTLSVRATLTAATTFTLRVQDASFATGTVQANGASAFGVTGRSTYIKWRRVA
jgi:hypothetical protein